MIISASRRTDIPNYFFDWFTNRLKERFVLVRNPINYRQLSMIDLSPDVVDCIVFWTKNPEPALDKLRFIHDYNFYFQFTLNSYSTDVEVNVPSKSNKIIDTFKKLSDRIGSEKVIWRYDPIFLSDKYCIDYHIKYFSKLAKELEHYTDKCVFSFIDIYPKIKKNVLGIGARAPNESEKIQIATAFKEISNQYGVKLETCAENIDLSSLDINHGRCIDKQLIERIAGYPIAADKDKNQRMECGCIESIDVGAYDTCRNGCKYCYACHSKSTTDHNFISYDAKSPILCSRIMEHDIIKERKIGSNRQEQIRFI